MTTTTQKQKGHVSRKDAAPTTDEKFSDNSVESQCQRLLAELAKRSLTTLEIRRELDILGVGPRIFDLRHRYGKNIQTIRVEQTTDAGQVHNVARYVLMPDAQSDLFASADITD